MDSIAVALDSVKEHYLLAVIEVPSRMEEIRRESVEVKQMERQSAGSRDVESEAVVVHFAVVVLVAAVVSDSAAESILQVKKVEVEFVPLKQAEVEFAPAIPPMNPDPTHTEEEAAAVVAVVAAAPELALGSIHFDLD